MSVYAATKAAVRNFARAWTMELKDRGIRVNVVAPDAIGTPGLFGLASPDAESQKALTTGLVSNIPHRQHDRQRAGQSRRSATRVISIRPLFAAS
jgi:NAD(P)-dependent dehydrogenase (short-subunit alcohol dehydrogenase family)